MRKSEVMEVVTSALEARGWKFLVLPNTLKTADDGSAGSRDPQSGGALHLVVQLDEKGEGLTLHLPDARVDPIDEVRKRLDDLFDQLAETKRNSAETNRLIAVLRDEISLTNAAGAAGRVHVKNQILSVGSKAVTLTHSEYVLAAVLLKAGKEWPGVFIPVGTICDLTEQWCKESGWDGPKVFKMVSQLRAKISEAEIGHILEKGPRGMGYRFVVK